MNNKTSAMIPEKQDEFARLIEVHGKRVKLGEALPDHIKKNLAIIIDKYCTRPTHATVSIHKERNLFVTSVHVPVNKQVNLNAEGSAVDPYASFHMALNHVAKRLRRYKRRLREDHKHQSNVYKQSVVDSYVLHMDTKKDEKSLNHASSALDNQEYFWESSLDLYTTDTTDDKHENPDQDVADPLIVSEDKDKVDHCSVGDAVMRMEMSGRKHFLFVDSESGRVNLIYVRDDGHIGWLDPRV